MEGVLDLFRGWLGPDDDNDEAAAQADAPGVPRREARREARRDDSRDAELEEVTAAELEEVMALDRAHEAAAARQADPDMSELPVGARRPSRTDLDIDELEAIEAIATLPAGLDTSEALLRSPAPLATALVESAVVVVGVEARIVERRGLPPPG